jgi:hypothetical protein
MNSYKADKWSWSSKQPRFDFQNSISQLKLTPLLSCSKGTNKLTDRALFWPSLNLPWRTGRPFFSGHPAKDICSIVLDRKWLRKSWLNQRKAYRQLVWRGYPFFLFFCGFGICFSYNIFWWCYRRRPTKKRQVRSIAMIWAILLNLKI